MSTLNELYKHSLALHTDLYEITMACAYWKGGMGDREAVFVQVFRENPFHGGFTMACGVEDAVEWVRGFGYAEDDLAYLGTLKGEDGGRLLPEAFLNYLRELRLEVDIDAVSEGTVVFPHEPIVRVCGPLLQCQLLETALLNIINFQTLIATKAARVCEAAGGRAVIEFGLRRAQGIDGGLSASRAAYVGGCAGTSNVLAGRLLGIPVKGTMTHSMVMAFDDEREAFRAYAKAMPNNVLLLVDTWDTLQGVRNATQVGGTLIGVRLDSGDLAYLSKQAREILDRAGFKDAIILASNELDEYVISSLNSQGAPIDVFGVGTRLATAYDQPALGGVYKLAAIRDERGRWQRRIKLSEQAAKIPIPGMLRVRRYLRGGRFVADAIYDEELGIGDGCTIVDAGDVTRRKIVPPGSEFEELLTPVIRKGKCVMEKKLLSEVQRRGKEQVKRLDGSVRRLMNPHQYPAGLERGLHELRMKLILEARGEG